MSRTAPSPEQPFIPLWLSHPRWIDRLPRMSPKARQITSATLIVTFAGILYAVAWPTFFLTHSLNAALVPILAATGTWPVLTASRWPVSSWALVAASCLVSAPLHANEEFALGWPVPFHLALAFTLAVVILRSSAYRIALTVTVTTALMLTNPSTVIVGWIVGTLVWSAFFLLLRWLLASRKQVRTESVRATEQSQLRVMAEERNRLVRDLHDVVAHQMSMIVVQGQSAPYRLQNVTPAIHAEFDSIADTAREALNQVRELLGVLRSDAESGATTPVGADQIEPVLTAARRAGMDVSWTIEGDLTQLDDAIGVVIQRVLQESLSNASRHAPGGKVLVSLTITTKESQVIIDNAPAAPGAIVAPEHSGGAGIPGMAARVQAIGGSFSALPAADGGFTVTAIVPLAWRTR